MTPPIGFQTKTNPESTSNLLESSQVHLRDAPETALPSISPVADYAYRIAALTAGLALISTFL